MTKKFTIYKERLIQLINNEHTNIVNINITERNLETSCLNCQHYKI